MVRLKERWRKRNVMWWEFQFLYGAIKSKLLFAFVFYQGNFNSFMVRLKVLTGLNLVELYPYFNSFMVRLKASIHCSLVILNKFISIPLWCD